MRSLWTARAVTPGKMAWGLSPASCRKVLLNDAVDDRRGAQPPAATHRLQPVAEVAALELVEQAVHQDRARCAQRVAHSDGAAVHGGLLEVGACLVPPREDDPAEPVVYREQV